MPLIENLELDALARDAAARSRLTFLLVVAPLDVRNGSGSAVNPIAFFWARGMDSPPPEPQAFTGTRVKPAG